MAKVVIVEDEPLVARLYEKSLAFDGHQVKIAVGGKAGVETIKKEMPDIVLLDIMMPQIDGMEVLDSVKKDPETAKIPVVMLTNLSGKHDAELAVSKGAVDYWVKKDTDLKKLSTKIKAVIAKHGGGAVNSQKPAANG